MFKKLYAWYENQTPTAKGFIWVGALLVVGIAFRWEFILENITRGFDFFKRK